MSSNSGGGVHRGDNLNSFQVNELKIFIIESLVADNLLKECDQLDGIVFVWLRQVDILQVNDKSLTVLWSIDSALRYGGLRAHLVEFLDNMESGCLRVAVNYSDLS